MIQIESVHIEEIRGIRNLTLTMNRGSFVISGPNGSGKSGVVDAIQFALTGEIGRLKGTGTGELKLAEHGPHVDRRSYPDAAFVRLDVHIPHLGKSASITRKIKKPKHPLITPSDDDVKAVFAELAEHPEITLARREIIKFILTEATQRSRDVQTLLKLDDIDQTRATLKTTENKLDAALSTARTQADTTKESLKRHLDIAELKADDLLTAVNQRRKVLGLPEIAELTKTTSVSEGISKEGASKETVSTKDSAIRDIKALSDLMAVGFEASTETEIAAILASITKLEEDAGLLPLIQRRSFFQTGLDLIDGPTCPLCDTAWDVDALREHLRDKLKKSKEAQKVQETLLASGRAISTQVTNLRALIEPLAKISEADKEFLGRLGEWMGGLQTFSANLDSVKGIVALKERLETGWASPPDDLAGDLDALREKVKVRPDKSETGNARDFLVVAQERLKNWQVARRGVEHNKVAASRGKFAYKAYCEVAEAALVGLYKEVEGDFSMYYQLLNHDDEGEFTAKFEPANGKLGFLVDFHKKGMFPPGAYHSEGHQDGMGVCLYLALMKRVLGSQFTLAVLDDVVMSVDSQHRKQFCKILKAHFPETQFVITTHDQVWTRQMRTEGLVSAKAAIAFHTWTVDTGPVLDEIAEVWDQIDEDLARNEIPTAAARLRRHLEYVAADLADELGAKVSFKGDGGYDMGDLLGAVIGRQGDLLKKAAAAAKSWDDAEQIAKVEEMKRVRTESLTACGGEQWIINKAVHYNEWANLSKEDFVPVVAAFKNLLHQFRCSKPKCDSWLSLSPKKEPTDLRCLCGSFRLNLRKK